MKNKIDLYSKKHYLIYKITNTDNGMIYIGKHLTYDVNDSYLGSSPYLQAAILKHGINSFKKEILFDFDNYDDMNNKEIEIVNQDFINRKDTYNAELGGNGGWNAVNAIPYKWICNPFLHINKKLYDDHLSQQMLKAGWTYGTLANKSLSTIIKDNTGKNKTVHQFANDNNLNERLVIRRLKLNWSIDEIVNIPEEYGTFKTLEEKYNHKFKSDKQLEYKKKLKQHTELQLLKNIKTAYDLYNEFLNIGREQFKAKRTQTEYRKCLAMFRAYVQEYTIKKQHAKYSISYNGKQMSMNKWRKELGISSPFPLYALLHKGKTFQEAFDILRTK